MLAKDKDSYSQSKRCRLGLIDFALANNKPPLNMFKQHPLSRSKLLCKLTGDTVNKSEEHIWKHIHGRRFLNRLANKETSRRKNTTATRTLNKNTENSSTISDTWGRRVQKKPQKGSGGPNSPTAIAITPQENNENCPLYTNCVLP
ncbi:SURFEIT LOCUS PROTEIN 2 (SURF2) [Salix purpurea]|uniref:SURFEIT LOCUS PROTEIN 2 (SURF2) n=1 Tax=Salix purpurea TaxID=77065 RepID=A0A9Q0W5N8_SALPP|nr:SURFEIT LOCUS PROTEIN 2 (SURF2) [Salix purpurea]